MSSSLVSSGRALNYHRCRFGILPPPQEGSLLTKRLPVYIRSRPYLQPRFSCLYGIPTSSRWGEGEATLSPKRKHHDSPYVLRATYRASCPNSSASLQSLPVVLLARPRTLQFTRRRSYGYGTCSQASIKGTVPRKAKLKLGASSGLVRIPRNQKGHSFTHLFTPEKALERDYYMTGNVFPFPWPGHFVP